MENLPAKKNAGALYVSGPLDESIGPEHIAGTDADIEQALETLLKYAKMSKGAFSDNTLRNQKCDLRKYKKWCLSNGFKLLPTTPEQLALFIDDMTETAKQDSINRYVSTIRSISRVAGYADPGKIDDTVYLALRRMKLKKCTAGEYVKQALGMNYDEVKQILDKIGAGKTLLQKRDKAMLVVAFCTMARASEVIRIKIEHIDFEEKQLLIPYTKTNKTGEARYSFLDNETIAIIKDWTLSAGITEGFLFRAIYGKTVKSSIGYQAFLERYRLFGFTTHSTRVGACQDQLRANISVAGIMQSMGVGHATTVARYSRKVDAEFSGSAQLAKLQGRD